jgi:hypothetical protein
MVVRPAIRAGDRGDRPTLWKSYAGRPQPISKPNAGPVTCRHRADPRAPRMWPMQDLFWIAATIGLLALTLAYVRLCDNA